MADLKPEKNYECYWVEDKDDDLQPRKKWEIKLCPIQGCKKERFKNCNVWSYESENKCQNYFLHHVMRSTLEGHGLDEVEALECLAKVEVEEKTEIWEEREKMREEWEDRKNKKATERSSSSKGKGKDGPREPPYLPPHMKAKGKKGGGKGKDQPWGGWNDQPCDQDWDGDGGDWGKGGEQWDGGDWGKGGQQWDGQGGDAWGGWGKAAGKGSQVTSLLVCFQQLDASF